MFDQNTIPQYVKDLKADIGQQIEVRADNLICFAKAWPLVYSHKNGIRPNQHAYMTFDLRDKL